MKDKANLENVLSYAGCILQFEINENGYIKLNIYEYDTNLEQFVNNIDRPIVLTMTTKSNRCRIVGSCSIEKGLGVLLHLITSSNSILMFIQVQSRPWSCQILYTLAIPSFDYGSMKFLAINSFVSLFRNDEQQSNGFYTIIGNEIKGQKKIEFIQCTLLTYIYCYLKDNYYWLMGTDFDSNTDRKSIQVYYGCPTSSLISFQTNQFVPHSFADNIQTIHVINHKLQLKTRSIVGDVIISSKDHRIFSCHNGTISCEISLNHLIHSIQTYLTIDNEQIFLFENNDSQSIEIFQYTDKFNLIPFTNSHETGQIILIDDFAQIGWKQILFLKTNIHSFMLTDFSQIHVDQNEFNDDYHTIEKDLSMEIDENELKTNVILAQDILRKRIINADFLVNESYFQYKQIENCIRKITNQNHLEDLSSQHPTDNLVQNSNLIIQLLDTNWFIYQTNLFLHVKIRNLTDSTLSSINLFAVEKNSNKTKIFQYQTASSTTLNEQMIFDLKSHSSSVFILTTTIEFDRDMDFELYIYLNQQSKLYRLGSIRITIDDLMNSNKKKVLQLPTVNNQSNSVSLTNEQIFIYLNTLFRLSINIESLSKCDLIEHFHQLLSTIDFKQIPNLSNIFIRHNQGDIFEHAVIYLANQDEFIVDDLIVHFYAKNSIETISLIKYILSKLDFQSFSLINSIDSESNNEHEQICTRIQAEIASYIDLFKQIPTVMRKLAPTTKSESYRLFKTENFQSFQNEIHLTDLLLASSKTN